MVPLLFPWEERGGKVKKKFPPTAAVAVSAVEEDSRGQGGSRPFPFPGSLMRVNLGSTWRPLESHGCGPCRSRACGRYHFYLLE